MSLLFFILAITQSSETTLEKCFGQEPNYADCRHILPLACYRISTTTVRCVRKCSEDERQELFRICASEPKKCSPFVTLGCRVTETFERKEKTIEPGGE